MNTHRSSEHQDHPQTLTVSSKGQITISAAARHKLDIGKGTHLLEIVLGDCLLYIPEHEVVSQLMTQLQNRLRRADLTIDDILADIEAHKAETFRSLYPELIDR
ncbi:MAG: hypothetical protein EPO21_03425 [Chloroflexota bacterium]|nr:MAG: hypothetical protein EPO21_03425 [Chloroflexota bacterium]